VLPESERSAADAISEAEDEAPIMEALLLSGENARMVTVEGDGNCLPRALAIACQDSMSYQEIRRATCDYVVRCWAGLGWPHITNEAAAKRWATRCRINGEWLEADFISAYCHMCRINVTLAMLDWRVAESGRRVPYLSKQLVIGAPDRPHDNCGLVAYVNRNHLARRPTVSQRERIEFLFWRVGFPSKYWVTKPPSAPASGGGEKHRAKRIQQRLTTWNHRRIWIGGR
jgi:hypothetical protein